MESALVDEVAKGVLPSNVKPESVSKTSNIASSDKKGSKGRSFSSKKHSSSQSTFTSTTGSNQIKADSIKQIPNNEADCLKICPEIIPRSAWRSRKPKLPRKHQMRAGAPVLFQSTAVADNCTTKEECLRRVKWMQTYHMEINEFSDIAHSFLIGEDGNVYEGRGWGYENEQGPGFVGIGYLGYYTLDSDTPPTRAMIRAAYRLILCGIMKGFIKNPFKKGIKTMKNGLPDPKMWEKYLLQAEIEF